MGSVVCYGDGRGNFSINDLPARLQLAPIFSFQKIDASKIKIDLERKLKQSASDKSFNPTNDLLKESTALTISEALRNGSQFFSYELIFSFERSNEKELFEDLKQSFSALNSFAEFQIETFLLTIKRKLTF